MAITPLGEEFKKFTFDGADSTDFGVQILGEGTFNAPKRVVESVYVPGRNGALLVDQGYYENIPVKYPAHLIADSTGDFADAISDFRNFLCSRHGYCRLQDDYNPDEYRLASYTDGLDADVDVLRAGKFDIEFDCKPQRYLVSGEELVTVSSGDTLLNPTEHPASPLLAITGYGDLNINGLYDINLSDALIGDVALTQKTEFTGMVQTVRFNKNQKLLNTGDSIKCVYITMRARIKPLRANGYTSIALTSVSDSNRTNFSSYGYVYPSILSGSDPYILLTSQASCYYANGTDTQKTNTVTVTGTVSDGNQTQNFTVSFNVTMGYYSDRVTAYWIHTIQDSYNYVTVDMNSDINTIDPVIGTSTKSVLGDPTYIDCDAGEAYQIIDDEPISLNRYIALGSDLPKLQSGENTITFDNTITELQIIPRWWKL